MRVQDFCPRTRRTPPTAGGSSAGRGLGVETARKVSELLSSIARLIRAVGVLADVLGKWFG